MKIGENAMKVRLVWYILILMLISGCSNLSPANPTLILNKTNTPQIVNTVSLPEATPTLTLHPTLNPSATFTLQPSETETALPTWSAQNGQENMLSLIEGNDECRLPCWGGIIPGQSNWQQSIHLLAPLSGIAKSTTRLDRECTFGNCNYTTWLYYFPPDFQMEGGLYVSLPQDKVHFISIEILKSPLPEGMSLMGILNTYGPPSSVHMDFNRNIPFEPCYNCVAGTIVLLLAYPKNNFVIIFYYDADQGSGTFIGCGKANSAQLFIYDDGTPLSSDESLVSVPDVHRLRVTGWRKIQDVTQLTIDSFFTQYKTSQPPCIETPVDKWK
jgi:hypothetical protein